MDLDNIEEACEEHRYCAECEIEIEYWKIYCDDCEEEISI